MLISYLLLMIQSSCTNPVLPTPTTAATPTQETATPSPVTPSVTPLIQGTWMDAPPLLTPRSAHAVASSDSGIYALAGTDDQGRPVLDVEFFDGNQWRVETTLPRQGLNAPTASIVGGQLFVMGGFAAVSNVPTDELYIYKLQTHEWITGSPLPAPRGGHAAVVLDGRIHLLGGGNSLSTIADHSQYDPATDRWTELAPVPRAEGSPAAVAVAGKIYVIGGRSGASDFGDVYIYDPATDTWSSGPSIEPRGTAGAVFYCGGIYLFGGESQAERQNLASVLRLDLDRNVWESVAEMPMPRKFARAVLYMDSIYIVGGSTVAANSHSPIGTASVQRFDQPGCS